MKVKYIYSACLEIDCDGFKILTDPWFTDGAYDGSWYQFPKINPFDFIEKPDLIYISHIHPDHYDATFLKSLIAKFGEGATKSGATLKGIFEKAIGGKKKKKEEK